jgi:hypothetical protein
MGHGSFCSDFGITLDNAAGDNAAGDNAAGRRITLATVFGEISQQSIHRRIFRGVDERSAFTAAFHQTGLLKMVQMKGQRGGRETELFSDLTRWQSAGTRLHE